MGIGWMELGCMNGTGMGRTWDWVWINEYGMDVSLVLLESWLVTAVKQIVIQLQFEDAFFKHVYCVILFSIHQLILYGWFVVIIQTELLKRVSKPLHFCSENCLPVEDAAL